MKKLLLGLLAAAVVTLTLAGCKNNTEDKGEPPVVEEAFFTPNISFQDKTLSYAREQTTTSITLSDTGKLVVVLKDIDHDLSQVQISTNSDFDGYIYWEWEKFVDDDEWWTSCLLSEEGLKPETIANLKGSNKTIYVRAMDSKKNYSEVKSITGVTIN